MKKVIITSISVALPALALLLFVRPGMNVKADNTVMSMPNTSTSVVASVISNNMNTDNTVNATNTTNIVTTANTAHSVATAQVISNTSDISVSSSPAGMYYVFVSPDNYYKIPGSSVQFTGTHFYPNETVRVVNNGSVIITTAADSSGNFTTGWITMPNFAGRQVYTFTGNTSNIPFSVGITVGNAYPWLILNTYYAAAGTPLTINGHGFGSNEPVTITFDSMMLGTVRTNLNGDFSLDSTVPAGTIGNHAIRAQGYNTGATVEATFSHA